MRDGRIRDAVVDPAKPLCHPLDETTNSLGIGGVELLRVEPAAVGRGELSEKAGEPERENVATSSPRSSSLSTIARPKPREPPEMREVECMGDASLRVIPNRFAKRQLA